MPRGKAEFETMEPIKSELASDFSQSNFGKELNIDLSDNFKEQNYPSKRIKAEELDPMRTITKGLNFSADMKLATNNKFRNVKENPKPIQPTPSTQPTINQPTGVPKPPKVTVPEGIKSKGIIRQVKSYETEEDNGA